MTTYCISDLHLPPAGDVECERFAAFCAAISGSAEQLYILGDLVDAWLGDDAGLQHYPRVVASIAALVDAGVAVTLLAGNHDFLYGEAFRAATGAQLASDPLPVIVAGAPFLLSHGDALCTGDIAYQEVRARMRSAAWQSEFLSRRIAQREAFARELRQASQTATAQKSDQIMDVAPQALRLLHAQYRTPVLIHGHTHRPAVHTDPQQEGFARRLVMGCWRETGEIVRIAAGQAELLAVETFLPG